MRLFTCLFLFFEVLHVFLFFGLFFKDFLKIAFFFTFLNENLYFCLNIKFTFTFNNYVSMGLVLAHFFSFFILSFLTK